MTGRRWQRVRARLRTEVGRRRMGAVVARDCTPPPPERFGSFGERSWVVPPARVTCPDRIFIGDDVSVLEHSWLSVVRSIDGVEPTLQIGSGTRIGRYAHIACVGSINIGARVLTSERVFIGDTYHGYEDPNVPIRDQPMAHPESVVIEDDAFLGIGSIVLMGVTVGRHACVAAGAVVTADVEPYTVVVGNPARAVRRWDPDSGTWSPVVQP